MPPHLNARPGLSSHSPSLSANLSPRDDIYFTEYIHLIKIYIYVYFRRLVLYTYTYCYPRTPPSAWIPVGLTATPCSVRKRCFITRAERSGHIFPVYVLLVCRIPTRWEKPVLCERRKNSSGTVFSLSTAMTDRRRKKTGFTVTPTLAILGDT
jgi:hypothetical protein